jgi:hypothetical protein
MTEGLIRRDAGGGAGRLTNFRQVTHTGLQRFACRNQAKCIKKTDHIHCQELSMKKTITFSNFDAELNTDCCDPYNNAELTLTFRMGFRQINPAGGADNGKYHSYGGSDSR